MSKLEDAGESLANLLSHPASLFSIALAGATALFSPTVWSAFSGALYASLGNLFPAVSIGLMTLAPMWPPSSASEWVVFIVGGAFAVKLLEKAQDEFQKRL